MNSEKTKLIAEATRLAIRYLNSSDSAPTFPSDPALATLDEFDVALPEDSTDGQAILELLDRIGSPATVRSTGGRYFGFVTGNSEPIASAAAILALAWDQNIAVPVMSPIASRLDAIVTQWICQLLGLPDSAPHRFVPVPPLPT